SHRRVQFTFQLLQRDRLGFAAKAQTAFGIYGDDQRWVFLRAGLLGLRRFGQRKLEGRLLLKGGGDHQKNQEDNQDIDQGDDDDLQYHQAALQAGDLVPRAGLDGRRSIGFGPLQMIGGQEEQAAHGRVVLLTNPPQHRHILRRLARLDGGFDLGRQNSAPAQS